MTEIHFRFIDLGMALQLHSGKINTDMVNGTTGYHPPEIMNEEPYDFKADIFMLGITFLVLVSSQLMISHYTHIYVYLSCYINRHYF